MISPFGYDVFFNAKPRAALCISGAGTHSVRTAQHSDDTIRSPAVGQPSPMDQPVPASHARPRQKPVLISIAFAHFRRRIPATGLVVHDPSALALTFYEMPRYGYVDEMRTRRRGAFTRWCVCRLMRVRV